MRTPTDPASGEPYATPSSRVAFDTTAILKRAQSGDSAALELLCRHLIPRLTRFAAGRLPSYARDLLQTEDLVQEALVRSLPKLDPAGPQSGSTLLAYLRSAVLNRVRDEVRRVARRGAPDPLNEQEPDPAPTALEELLGREARQRYDTALARLPAADREAVIGRIELGLSFAELAGILGKPSADAVRMTVNRALVKLAREMDHERR